MKICAYCKKEIAVDKFFTRRSACPSCGRDLHICMNCAYYSETSHNKCLEPKAEFLRSRDTANFCDYFRYRESISLSSSAEAEKEEARKKLDELFRK